MSVLIDLGWPPDAGFGLEPGLEVARIVEEQRGLYRVVTEAGERWATLGGRLQHRIEERADLPAVGDWVAVQAQDDERVVVREILPRRTVLRRKAAGRGTEAQVLAANVDVALLAMPAFDVNLRRLERFLALTWESGARPIVVLTKADVTPDPEAAVEAVRGPAMGAPVLAVSALTGFGMAALRARFVPRETSVVLGLSGVGKSTLINALLGHDVLATRAVRESDGRGVHTTTSRHLLVLPGGALVIDTPGIRELQLWESGGLEQTFGDVEALAENCRYRDCTHEAEPGCAVRAAVEAGELEAGHVENWHKLERERAFLDRRKDALARAAHEKKWKAIHKSLRGFEKGR